MSKKETVFNKKAKRVRIENTKGYKDRRARELELRSLKVDSLSSTEMANAVSELCKLYSVIYRFGYDLSQHNTSGQRYASSAGRRYGNEDLESLIEAQSTLNSRWYYINNTVAGYDVMSLEDYKSLLNESITTSIKRLGQDRDAEAMVVEVSEILTRNNIKHDINKLMDNFRNLEYTIEQSDGGVLSMSIGSDSKRLQELQEKLSSYKIKSIKKIETVSELYGIACNHFKSKVMRDSASSEFRRRVNNERGRKSVDEIIQEDIKDRHYFLQETREHFEEGFDPDKVSREDIFNSIKEAVAKGKSGQDIIKMITEMHGSSIGSVIDMDTALAGIKEYVKKNLEEDNVISLDTKKSMAA